MPKLWLTSSSRRAQGWLRSAASPWWILPALLLAGTVVASLVRLLFENWVADLADAWLGKVMVPVLGFLNEHAWTVVIAFPALGLGINILRVAQSDIAGENELWRLFGQLRKEIDRNGKRTGISIKAVERHYLDSSIRQIQDFRWDSDLSPLMDALCELRNRVEILEDGRDKYSLQTITGLLDAYMGAAEAVERELVAVEAHYK